MIGYPRHVLLMSMAEGKEGKLKHIKPHKFLIVSYL